MTKTKILEKSLELFSTKGYFNCSMDDIAKSVNIKKPSLYFHYPSKESLFHAVFQKILENYKDFMNSLLTDDENSSLEDLAKIFTKYVNNCVNNIEMQFWDRYYYYPPDCFKEEIQSRTYQIEMDLINRIIQVVQRGIHNNEIKPIDARSIAVCFYNMMIGLSMGVKFYTNEQINEQISRCLDVFLSGIQTMA